MTATEPPRPLPARPTRLTVLALIWISLGAVMTMFSLVFAAVVLLAPGPFSPALPDGPTRHEVAGMALIEWLFAHFEVVALAQLGVSVATLLGGAYLMLQRAWARTLLEVLSWLGVAYVLAFTVLFTYHWLSFFTAVPGDPPTVDQILPLFQAFGVVAAVANGLVFVAPLGVLIWLLRHREVRKALVRPGSGPHSR